MKLTQAHVTNFRSIEDSEPFSINDLTCLVGKNEAGKTSLLQALYGLKPFGKYSYDKTRDYPRRYLSRYDDRHENGESKVIDTEWVLSAVDKAHVALKFGPNAIKSDVIKISKTIGSGETAYWIITFDEVNCLKYLYQKFKLNPDDIAALQSVTTSKQLFDLIQTLPEKSPEITSLLAEITSYREHQIELQLIDILSKRQPKFFYTSHFDRMAGEVSLVKLKSDIANDQVKIEDQIFIDFLEYAGTSIEELEEATHYEDLKAKCEGASNEITDEIFQFWSQNESLRVEIDLGEGKPKDPPPFNSGTIAKIRIENTNHRVSVPLSERSAGFVWFFSFLSQFKQLKKTTGNAIILLDEPGLTLHGKAQADLLRYIEERLLPEHQVIYTTHSPFMVPTQKMDNVRIVEDIIKHDGRKPIICGTKVSSDVLTVDKDTLFPLQGALGYELTQSLFIGKNTLLVEGPSDILYLQAFSSHLKSLKKEGLDSAWTICPSGGIDKISPFASLFGSNNLNIAVLCDIASGDKAKIDKLRKSQVLNAGQLYTAADFNGKSESDIEDLLDPDLYVELLNKAYHLNGKNTITIKKLNEALDSTERIVKKAEALFRLMPASVREFDHFHASSWLISHPEFLQAESSRISSTLEMFEKVFKTYNLMIKS